MLLSATLSLTGRHSEKLRRCFPNHWKICCYWIPLLSLVSSSHSFQPLSTSFNRPFQTSTLLSASSYDLEHLTVVQLKDELRDLGLQVSGKKAVLINRLEDYNPDLAMTPSKKTKRAPKDEAAKETKAELPRKRSRKTEKDASDEAKKKSPVKKSKAADHQRITDRDEIPKLWDSEKAQENGSYTFKIASWNVAGLRAFVRKQPDALRSLANEYDLDMLCLQETKLQEMHLDDPKLNFRGMLEDDGYKDYWNCSTEKKGYSGTAVFVKDRGQQISKQTSIGSFFAPKSKASAKEKTKSAELPVSPDTLTPTNVSYNIGKPIDNEGRTIVVEYPWATLTNVYVPNSGQDLKRLDYRTTEWDKDFLEFHEKKQGDRGLPVIWLGDLNIAHKAEDVWNDGAKHLEKQAGVTPQERASFQEQLDSGFIDAFRKLHPSAKGHYSYWSQRAGNRAPNKGLRLDYFICSPDLFEQESQVVVRDSYILKDCTGSDHCPVVLELEIKP